MREDFKSGFVTLIGRPNVGKSTLMNHLIGQKIAITSNKPQTTRNRIQTVLTTEEGQIVFVDTPGIHKAKNKLGEYMVNIAERSLNEVDVVLWLVEPSAFIGAGDRHIIEQLKKVTPTPTKKPEPKPSIRLNYTSIPLQVKKSTTAISIKTTAIKGDKIKSAKSSNSKVAKVSVKNGKLTIKGRKAGKATVTVTSAKGAKATVKVTVQKKKVALKKLQAITSRKVTVKKGKKTTLKVANSPITAKASVKWKTSNKKVASVTSKGVVKGLKKGRATITAYSGKVKVTFKVIVK